MKRIEQLAEDWACRIAAGDLRRTELIQAYMDGIRKGVELLAIYQDSRIARWAAGGLLEELEAEDEKER